MWTRLPLLEYFEYMQQFKQRLGSLDSFNENANLLFIFFFFILFSYLMFYLLMKKLLLKSRIPKTTHRLSIEGSFNILFFLCSTSFLILYHSYFINPELNRELGRWYPKRKSFLFYQPCDLLKFKLVSFNLVAFSLVSCVLDLNSRDVSNAISKFLHACLLLSCYNFGLENYSVVLSINLGLFNLFTELLSLLAMHSDKDKTLFRVFAVFKFASWIYIFLNLLPFQYMVPTFHAKDFKLSLNILLISWYISQIWISPLLKILYHQLYHLTESDCPGENSLARCLMLKDSPEFRHFINLKRAYLEVKLSHQRYHLNKLNLSDSAASATAFQTLKCVMTLKRKLKRIRESQRNDQRRSE